MGFLGHAAMWAFAAGFGLCLLAFCFSVLRYLLSSDFRKEINQAFWRELGPDLGDRFVRTGARCLLA